MIYLLFIRKFIIMKKYFMLLLLLPFAACKKNEDPKPEYDYEVVVECTDCSFSVADFDGKRIAVKGEGVWGMNYVPSSLIVNISSNLEEEKAKITFQGSRVKYAALTVYEGIIFKQSRNIAKPLPPTR